MQSRRRVRKRITTEALDEISPRDKFRMHSFITLIDVLHLNLVRRATLHRSVAEETSSLRCLLSGIRISIKF